MTQIISHITRKVLIMHQIKVHVRILDQKCVALQLVMAKQTAKGKQQHFLISYFPQLMKQNCKSVTRDSQMLERENFSNLLGNCTI